MIAWAHTAVNEYSTGVIATIINAIAVIIGSVVGLSIGSRLGETAKYVVFSAIGVVSLVLGISMALETQRFLYLALSLVLGGLAGTALRIEDGIFSLGERLKKFAGGTGAEESPHEAGRFAQGFLTATVLYCVGSLTILGAFEAGVMGDYELLLTKSVMDGFMSVLLAASYGIGVAFSALSILFYQGALTLAAGMLRPIVTPLVLSEISGAGGAMVIMIGLNLLNIRKIKTADFLPALVIVVLLVLADPWIGRWVL